VSLLDATPCFVHNPTLDSVAYRGLCKRRRSLAISLVKINRYWSTSALALLVSRIGIADHSNNTLATNHLAVSADFLY
jgi:hypothetical protein